MAKRSAGLLLHPTSLPGAHGIGDLGRAAESWLGWLAKAGQALWQVLPLGPPGPTASPYDGPSGFAGNPLLISLEALGDDGLLTAERLRPVASPAFAMIDFGSVQGRKEERLQMAWAAYLELGPEAPMTRELENWVEAPEQKPWLDDWALFAALRERHGSPWLVWPAALRDRRESALAEARRELAAEIAFQRFLQFVFWRQWRAIRRQAAAGGIRILGDLPIYLPLDSAEVWCRPDLFDLDAEGRPRHVSGVPPDAYSEEGQLWGHPLYRWDRMREEGYAWWIERLRHACRGFDLVRLDHFRGFAGYWEVPAGAPSAAAGRWREGPGRELFEAFRRALGELPLVVEDLGQITDDVRALRRGLGLPGMRVLQFGLADGDEEHRPQTWGDDVIAYTATHDNDTCRGWFKGLDPELRRRVLADLGGDADAIHWTMIGAVLDSDAAIAVVPVQDLLGLGSEARLNEPGRAEGNWRWRLRPGQLTPELARRLRRLTGQSGRLPSASATLRSTDR